MCAQPAFQPNFQNFRPFCQVQNKKNDILIVHLRFRLERDWNRFTLEAGVWHTAKVQILQAGVLHQALDQSLHTFRGDVVIWRMRNHIFVRPKDTIQIMVNYYSDSNHSMIHDSSDPNEAVQGLGRDTHPPSRTFLSSAQGFANLSWPDKRLQTANNPDSEPQFLNFSENWKTSGWKSTRGGGYFGGVAVCGVWVGPCRCVHNITTIWRLWGLGLHNSTKFGCANTYCHIVVVHHYLGRFPFIVSHQREFFEC